MKHQNVGEADRLLIVYTKEHGKIKAVARGSRKVRSKLAGSLEPFILARLMVARGRHFETVAGAEVIRNFRALKRDLSAVTLATYLAQVLDRSTKLHQRDSRIFVLLKDILEYLDSGLVAVKKLPLVRWFFVWRYLTCLGYQPELYACLSCHRKVSGGNNYFSFKRGGVVDEPCRSTVTDGVVVTASAIKVLRLLSVKGVEEVIQLRLPPPLAEECERLTTTFLNYTQEQELGAETFSVAR